MSKNRRQAILLFFFLSYFSVLCKAQIHVSEGSFVFVSKETEVTENLQNVATKEKPTAPAPSPANIAASNASRVTDIISDRKKTSTRKKKDILKTRQSKAKSTAAYKQSSKRVLFRYNTESAFSFSVPDSVSKPAMSPDSWGKWLLLLALLFLEILSFSAAIHKHYCVTNLLRTVGKIFRIRPPPVM